MRYNRDRRNLRELLIDLALDFLHFFLLALLVVSVSLAVTLTAATLLYTK